MNDHDPIPELLDLCQHDEKLRPLAQLALERYSLIVTQIAHGAGAQEAKLQAISYHRLMFEHELRNILVPFLELPSSSPPAE